MTMLECIADKPDWCIKTAWFNSQRVRTPLTLLFQLILFQGQVYLLGFNRLNQINQGVLLPGNSMNYTGLVFHQKTQRLFTIWNSQESIDNGPYYLAQFTDPQYGSKPELSPSTP